MENKHVLIVEHNTNKLNIINESLTTNKKLKIGGIFTEFDVENRNKRFYNARNFIPCMESLLAQKQLLGAVYGELNHPEGFDIDPDRVCIAIETLVHNQEQNRVDGSVTVLSSPKGQIIRSILEDGFPVFVSSRSSGITRPGNIIEVKELHTYDAVLNPGFASTRQTPINESFGFKQDDEQLFRIYEVASTIDVETLTRDNKNDNKTKRDLMYMEQSMIDELAKMEARITESVKSKNVSPSEVVALSESYEKIMSDLGNVKKYLEFFKKNYGVLVKETKSIKKELNENTEYYNHISKGLNNVQENVSTVNEKINSLKQETEVISAFAEHVAKETEVTQKFAESIAKETEVTQKFAEHVAKETEIAQKFAESIAKETVVTQKFVEHVAKETEVTQKFAESIAKETQAAQKFAEYIAEKLKTNNDFTEYTAKEIDITQKFVESVAKEYKKDSYFISYIADKVEGTMNYVGEAINKIKSTTPVNESVTDDIHSMDSIEDYLGLEDEQKLVNTVQNNIEDEGQAFEKPFVMLNDEEELATDFDAINFDEVDTFNPDADTTDIETIDTITTDLNTEEIPGVLPAEEVEDIDGMEDVEGMENVDTTEEVEDIENIEDVDTTEEVEDIEDVDATETEEASMVSALVNVLSSGETGIVMEVTPENKLIVQISGSDETVEVDQDEVEVLDTEEGLVESVTNVLNKVKNAKLQANKNPHFFTFLNESEILNFKLLDTSIQHKIVESMENATYFSEQDVLNVIGETINKDTRTYQERLISAMPSMLKESWNALSKDSKEGYIAETTFFNLSTTADIESYWNTREFAKKASNKFEIITESVNNDEVDEFSPEFIEAFRKSAMGK